MQNFFSNMLPGSSQGGGGPHDDVPWWMRYGAKMLGAVGGGAAMFFGIWCIIGNILTPLCIVAGIWQMLAGFASIVIEAPFCCFCVPGAQDAVGKLDARPLWQKGALYLILSVPPVAMCFGISTLIGSGLIFGVAVLYGMQVMGKKGSREDMVAAASGMMGSKGEPSDGSKSGLTGSIYGQDVEAAKLPSKGNI